MNKEHYLLQPQQQKLEFALDDTWSRLPASCHRECKMALTRVLVEVIQCESEERNEHVRQDPR